MNRVAAPGSAKLSTSHMRLENAGKPNFITALGAMQVTAEQSPIPDVATLFMRGI